MKYIPLVQICDFQGGSQPPKDQWIDHKKDGYIRMLQIRDFTQPDKDKVEFVRVSKTIKTCQEDDILIGRYGASVGKILTGLAGAYNVAIIKAIPDTNKLTKRFLYYYLSSQYFQNFILSVGSRAAQAGFNKEDLSDAQFPDMLLEEQRIVVSRLDKISELIALRKEQLAKLDELVKARFVELFDVYTETAKLADVATVSGGLTKNAKRDKLPLRMPYLRVANVSFASIDVSEMLDIGLTEEEYKKTLLQNGDLLFVEGNGSPDQIGRVAIWRNEIVPCVHQNHLIKSRFNKGQVIPTFAMYYFMTSKGREQIKGKAVSTSGLYTLSVSKISDLMVPVPPIELQNQFAAFVEQTDKSKLVIQQSLDKLETLKKSLMQEYFG